MRCIVVTTILCFAMHAHAAGIKKRILILGDSWASSIATTHHDPTPPGFGSFDAVLAECGFPTYVTEGATAWGGRTAQQFATRQNYRDLVTQTLTANPDIVAVHLLLGGNDFLSTVSATNIFAAPWNSATRDIRWNEIKGYLQSVVDLCLSIRPGINVLISDYDYLGRDQALGAYASLGWTFGGMTQFQINAAFLELGLKKQTLAAQTDGCHYVSNWGVFQHYFSYPIAGLPLPGVYPDYLPYYGGDVTASMPPAANVGDGIHPNDAAHRHILRRCVEQFYAHWLRDVDANGLSYSDETRDLDPLAAGVQNPFDPDVADTTGDVFSNAPDGVVDGDNDYDGDSLSNAAELNEHHTNPLSPDSDGDGLPDEWELAHGLNPVSAMGENGASGDPDHDGLDNAEELARNTNPRAEDTDGDGLPDGWEAAHALNPLRGDGDDGARADIDGDRLDNEGECLHGTHPRLPDTDGGGEMDGPETMAGRNPLDGNDDRPYDVNCDGTVDISDVQLTINSALKLPVSFVTDVNLDGAHDAMDVQLVINAALRIL